MTDSIESLRQQLLALRAQHLSGALPDSQYAKRRSPLERKLVDLVVDGASLQASAPSAQKAAASARPAKMMWIGLAAFAVVVAGAGYWWTGAPDQSGRASLGSEAGAEGPDGAASAPHDINDAQFAALVERLAARLKEQPGDVEGWRMLGRSYIAMGKPAEAVAALEQAVKLTPDDASGLADYADAMALRDGRKLEGEPTKIIERALKADPDNLKALTLAGTAAFNRGDYAQAVKHWDRAVKVGPPDSPIVEQARSGAAEARERGKLPATAASDKAPAAAAAGGGKVAGTVTLAPALKGKVSPDDAVFIFARAAEGSRMPLAMLRKQVKDLPITFQLDDSQSLSPDAKLSTAGRVIVGARVSKSGQAMPQPGDLEGLSAPADIGSTSVAVVIASAIKK